MFNGNNLFVAVLKFKNQEEASNIRNTQTQVNKLLLPANIWVSTQCNCSGLAIKKIELATTPLRFDTFSI